MMAFDFWAPTYTASDGTIQAHGFTGNTFASNVWDKVFFASAPTPGLAEVTVDKERACDEKKAAGSDGARLTIHGSKPAKIEIRLTIWTPEQLRALNDLWPILMTPPYKTVTTTVSSFINPLSPSSAGEPTTVGTTTVVNTRTGATTTVPVVATKTQTLKSKQAVTFDVTHPMFKLHGIKAVQIIGGRGPEPSSIVRARTFTIKAVEYMPPGKANATKTDVQPLSSAYDPGAYPTPGSNPSNTGP